MTRTILAVIIAAMLTVPAAFALPSYSGSLSTPVGVHGTGIWVDNFTIAWQISQMGDLSWCYNYYITELDGSPLDPGALSHWIVEVSPGTTLDDFWGFNGQPIEIGDNWETEAGFTFEGRGMKLDYGGEGQTEWSFYSWRNPVWGDFFAKDGQAGGEGLNTAWNAGFFDDDPLDPAADGSIGYKILRPDTETMIPEPTTIGLLGLGLVGLGARLRKRR